MDGRDIGTVVITTGCGGLKLLYEQLFHPHETRAHKKVKRTY